MDEQRVRGILRRKSQRDADGGPQTDAAAAQVRGGCDLSDRLLSLGGSAVLQRKLAYDCLMQRSRLALHGGSQAEALALGQNAIAQARKLDSGDAAEDRLKKRQEKETKRQSATRKLRLPGKLADCSKGAADDTEILRHRDIADLTAAERAHLAELIAALHPRPATRPALRLRPSRRARHKPRSAWRRADRLRPARTPAGRRSVRRRYRVR